MTVAEYRDAIAIAFFAYETATCDNDRAEAYAEIAELAGGTDRADAEFAAIDAE